MRLIEKLERRLDAEQSFFQSQLLREDIERLAKMRDLVSGTADAAAFRKTALRLGWTAGDLRTHEIRAPLEALADAVYAYETGARGPEQEERLEQAWMILHRVRMERLMGCLSTPAPKPVS
jgi:hypothetical protein